MILPQLLALRGKVAAISAELDAIIAAVENDENTSDYVLEIEDKFDRPNGALGGDWPAAPAWSVASGVAVQASNAVDVLRHPTEVSSVDHWARATRESGTTGAVTVCVRVAPDASQFYMAGYNTASSEWGIWSYDGSFTQLASASATVGDLVYFRLEAVGDVLRLLVADPEGAAPVEVLAVELADPFEHTGVGIRGNSSGGTVNRIDDFGAGTFGS